MLMLMQILILLMILLMICHVVARRKESAWLKKKLRDSTTKVLKIDIRLKLIQYKRVLSGFVRSAFENTYQ